MAFSPKWFFDKLTLPEWRQTFNLFETHPKHSHAKSVNIFLGQNGPVISLEIVDDGIGFDVARAYQEGKMGLPDMDDHASELGGQLTVTSEPGHGTRIRVDVIL
jgi:signal transduction histidine kinase